MCFDGFVMLWLLRVLKLFGMSFTLTDILSFTKNELHREKTCFHGF